ncbi:Hypothetical predicted protein [Mytilus galloprovincialis]|uniref:Uncharacterized protein n=1 Tax=Mytilus galloprovincialis TaxID=29158 RepID=A0A8B6GCS6_MYTGA|nr:Hypothetical predicted protein [Mytilus galloprovincialis]
MASLTFPVLVLAAVCIFHTETGDAKAVVQHREKRAPNFLAYPRLGRAMDQHSTRSKQNFFHWPRSGKRGDAEMCCDGLIAYMNDDDIFNTVCNAPQCCDGYEEKIKRPHNSKNIFFVCVRSEYDESQGKLEA